MSSSPKQPFTVALYERPKDKKPKEAYKTPEELKLLPEASANYSKIVDVFKNIDTTIEKGDEQCKKVLDNHEKQFLLAYRAHMLSIYKEIGKLQQKSSDTMAKNLKESYRYKVEEALKFFKEETLRLSKIYKENEAEIERLKKVAETKEFDKKFIEMQIDKKRQRIDALKTSVEKTTSLFQRLVKDSSHNERLIMKPRLKMLPSDYNKGIEDFMIKLMESGASDEEIINEVGKYMQLYSTEVESQIKHLRSELEYEKAKQQQVRKSFLDQVTTRSELETFFFECLGEMRKEILHKGPKGLVQDTTLAEGNAKLDANKYQALQAILSNDRILITLFDEIFGPPAKRQEESLFPAVKGGVKPIMKPGYQDMNSYADCFPQQDNDY